MRILILGGTIFLGRHVTESALARGHEVVHFNRGRHGPDLYPELERIRGDRDGDLEPLRGLTFDAVVDTSGYVPRLVGDSARLLADATEHYTFVSSLSVYSDETSEGQDESAPVAILPDPTVEEVTGETYGGLKALCEAAAEREMPGRALALRPGLIVGPLDPTDRFTYWPVRVARGGEVLAPAPADFPVEFTDGRDLGAFIVRCAEERATGTIDVSGPDEPRPGMGALLETCRAVSGSDAVFRWAGEEFLAEHEVRPWTDMPLFTGTGAPGLATRNGARARAAGITFRPMEETVRDTIARAREDGRELPLKAGLDPAREAEVVAKLAGPGEDPGAIRGTGGSR